MPAVSVLVPCYNVERYIRQCMDSVVGQTLRDIEIICLNDGSTDDTLAILQEYAAQDSRIHIIDKSNSGYGDSMNKGLEAAAGEYIGIVESDDWVDADMFETLYSAAKEHDCDLVKSNYYDYCGGVSTLNEIIPPEDANMVISPRERTAIFVQPAYIWTAIYRQNMLKRENVCFLPTQGASYQDTSFNFKTLACAEKTWFMRKAFVHYRRDNENSSVKSTGKIYCICDEYAEIENFIRKDTRFIYLYPIVLKMKYQSYFWNFRRLALLDSIHFSLHVSGEFKEAFHKGRINRNIFKSKHYKRLFLWAFYPKIFLLTESIRSNGRRKICQYIKKHLFKGN